MVLIKHSKFKFKSMWETPLMIRPELQSSKEILVYLLNLLDKLKKIIKF